MFLGCAETIDDLLPCFRGVAISLSIYCSVLHITTAGARTRLSRHETTRSRSPSGMGNASLETPKPSEIMEQHGKASSPALLHIREGG